VKASATIEPMPYDSQKFHRRSLRLRGYDYSQAGLYFVTVCAQDRACLFGEVIGDQMHVNDVGRVVLAEWNRLADRFPAVELDTFGVMPNHIHGIIAISTAGQEATTRGATTRVAPTLTGPMRSTERVGPVGAGLVPAPRVTGRMRSTERKGPVGAGLVPAPVLPATMVGDPRPRLGDVVGAFKSLTTDLYVQGVKQNGWLPFRRRLWQRNYHEHIIRNDGALNRIRQYIAENPANWASDPENPQAGPSNGGNL
jgi:putative transposase